MKCSVSAAPLAIVMGTAVFLAGATPATAKTLSLTYDIQMEFIKDHVRQLSIPGPDDYDPNLILVAEVCHYGQPCYPEDWRPIYGWYNFLEPGDIIEITLSADVTETPDGSGWRVDVGSASCTSGSDPICSNYGSFYGHGFNPKTDALSISIEYGWRTMGKNINLSSMTAWFSSEFGSVHEPKIGDGCSFRPSAPNGFCWYWDYEAHFKVTSFTVQGLHVIPVPPALPLLASGLLGLAALRRWKVGARS